MNEHMRTNPEGSNPQSGKGKKQIWLLAGIIALLVGTNIYFYFSKTKLNTQYEQAFAAVDSLVSEQVAVRDEFSAALVRLDMLVSRNAELDSLASGQEQEITKLKQEIRQLLSKGRLNESDLGKARDLIANLKGKVKTYEERIAVLEDENARLSAYSELVVSERDATVADNIALRQKVRLGAVLKISNISIKAIDLVKEGRKEKETGRARKVDMLRVTFDIEENRLIEDGMNELQLRIVNPSGQLLSNAAYGSGVSETHEGKPLAYTLAKKVALKKGERLKGVTADWHQDSDYQKGNYQVEIYNDGFLVGAQTVRLK